MHKSLSAAGVLLASIGDFAATGSSAQAGESVWCTNGVRACN